MSMFKIGADPEFFLRDKATGKFVSAHGIVPGTKRQPLPVDKGAVQVDGMALEFNIDPAENAEDFENNIRTVLTQLREMVDPQLEFVFEPVAQFGKEYIDSQPAVAKELGCEPDYNAWTGQINPKPNSDMGFRTASGHVHIGWTNQQDITHPDHIEACHMLVKQLDFYLGIPALIWDKDEVRSSMYGAPGAYRPKHYGVEYRVLSNVWLNNPNLIRYVFNQTRMATEQLMNQNNMVGSGFDINRIRDTYSMEPIRDMVSYSIPHLDSKDAKYIRAMASKSNERPTIIERRRKQDEDMYFYHRDTHALVTFEEASAEKRLYTHENIYVRYCRDYGLGKPTSLADAEQRYMKMMTDSLAPVATKKKVKKDAYAQAWSFNTGPALPTGSFTVALDDLYNIPSTLSTGNI